MQLSELDNYFRVLTSETDPVNGRWTYADAATLINQSRFSINGDIDWPQGTILSSTNYGQQEYQLPPLTRALRVYLGGPPGQIIVKTDIPTMQGDQIQFYDQTAANNTPQWLATQPTEYPVQNPYWGSPWPDRLPFFQGARPQWYPRGGNIGFVPVPVANVAIQVDIVPRPIPLVNQTDVDNLYDTFFKEAIVQGAVMRAMQADRDMEARMAAAQAYAAEMSKLRDWVADMTSGAPKGPVLTVYRGFYQGPKRGSYE